VRGVRNSKEYAMRGIEARDNNDKSGVDENLNWKQKDGQPSGGIKQPDYGT
jgi:hypothetical protein